MPVNFAQNKAAVLVLSAIVIAAVLGVFIMRGADPGGDDGKETGDGEGTGINFTVERETASGTLTFGAGGGATSSVDLVTFTVNEGARKVKVICDGDNGTLGAGDIDMNVYGANDGYGPDARKMTSATGGSYEVVEMDRKDIEKRYGYGEYTVELICFAGLFLDYDLYMYVYYAPEGDGGDDGDDDDGGEGNGTTSVFCLNP
jgi:hypothetical protein